MKLLDDEEAHNDVFDGLEEDELELLEEILDKLEFYIEIGGPFLIIFIPMVLWWIRSRIVENYRFANV